jgi:hypothetical protein
VLLGEISRVGFQGWLRHTVQFLVVGVEIGDRTLLFGCSLLSGGFQGLSAAAF